MKKEDALLKCKQQLNEGEEEEEVKQNKEKKKTLLSISSAASAPSWEIGAAE